MRNRDVHSDADQARNMQVLGSDQERRSDVAYSDEKLRGR